MAASIELTATPAPPLAFKCAKPNRPRLSANYWLMLGSKVLEVLNIGARQNGRVGNED
jgi:hypothetical protein